MGNGRGYNWNKGMSNNAVSAKEDNKKPLSDFKKSDIEQYDILIDCDMKVKDIKLFAKYSMEFRPSEWHHTGKYFNQTDFYDLEDLVENLYKDDSYYSNEHYNNLSDADKKNIQQNFKDEINEVKAEHKKEQLANNSIGSIFAHIKVTKFERDKNNWIPTYHNYFAQLDKYEKYNDDKFVTITNIENDFSFRKKGKNLSIIKEFDSLDELKDYAKDIKNKEYKAELNNLKHNTVNKLFKIELKNIDTSLITPKIANKILKHDFGVQYKNKLKSVDKRLEYGAEFDIKLKKDILKNCNINIEHITRARKIETLNKTLDKLITKEINQKNNTQTRTRRSDKEILYFDTVNDWVKAKCPHPVSGVVLDEKEASKFNWKMFQEVSEEKYHNEVNGINPTEKIDDFLDKYGDKRVSEEIGLS